MRKVELHNLYPFSTTRLVVILMCLYVCEVVCACARACVCLCVLSPPVHPAVIGYLVFAVMQIQCLFSCNSNGPGTIAVS